MVIYDLQCHLGHRFEGWFLHLESFEEQKEQGLVSCSLCGSHLVEKIPSGGHIAKKTTPIQSVGEPQQPVSLPSKPHMANNLDPVTLIKLVSKYIKDNAKDVGEQFAKTATLMHKGKTPSEPIHGTATEEEFMQLEEEGVAYSVLPKLNEQFEN